MRLSIIIPTIRGVKQLNKIIEKIQSYKNDDIQIIIVNDDPFNIISVESKNISCDNKFPGFCGENLVFINNDKNYGPGLSRNIGVKRASGKYVCFVDDDDEVDLSFLEEFDFKEDDVDIYFMRFEDSSGTFSNDELFRIFNGEAIFTSDRLIKYWNGSQKLATHCQPYIFKKEYLIKENIRFPSTHIVEDMVFNTLCIIKARKIQLVDFNYYRYNSALNSLKSSSGIKRAIDVLIALKYLLKEIYGIKLNNARKEFIAHTINFLSILFIVRASLALNQEQDFNIQLDGFNDKDIKIMLELGININGILGKKNISSNEIFVIKANTLNKLRLLGIDKNSKIYLYCCGQLCEYFQELIKKTIGSDIKIVDDKVGLLDNKIITIDSISINPNARNFFILCNQQKWINSKIEYKLINAFQNQIEDISHAMELLG